MRWKFNEYHAVIISLVGLMIIAYSGIPYMIAYYDRFDVRKVENANTTALRVTSCDQPDPTVYRIDGDDTCFQITCATEVEDDGPNFVVRRVPCEGTPRENKLIVLQDLVIETDVCEMTRNYFDEFSLPDRVWRDNTDLL